MNAEKLLNDVREGNVEVPDGSALIMALVDKDGSAELAGGASPQVFRALGIGFIELAVKAEIKQSI